jgi:hypothetical protein
MNVQNGVCPNFRTITRSKTKQTLAPKQEVWLEPRVWPPHQLPGVVVMLRSYVMAGVLIDAGCGLFERVRLKR